MKYAANFLVTWMLLILALFAAAAQAQDETATEPADSETAATEQADTDELADSEPADTETADTDEPTDSETADTETVDAEPPQANLEDNMCVLCHGNADVWDDSTKHLFVRAEDLANDIHWKKGILCQDCHGGNAQSTDLRTAHAMEDGFRKIDKAANEPAFCGYCHADQEKMKSYGSSSPTTIVSDF